MIYLDGSVEEELGKYSSAKDSGSHFIRYLFLRRGQFLEKLCIILYTHTSYVIVESRHDDRRSDYVVFRRLFDVEESTFDIIFVKESAGDKITFL